MMAEFIYALLSVIGLLLLIAGTVGFVSLVWILWLPLKGQKNSYTTIINETAGDTYRRTKATLDLNNKKEDEV